MIRFGCLALALVWLLLSSPAAAQEGWPSSLGTGTSRVGGQVVAADTGAPLPGAEVRIAWDLSTGSRGRTETADASGVFEFSGLPDGKYVLTAVKSGYVLGTVTAWTPPRGVVVRVTRDQSVRATIAMTRGAAISGRIVDALGEPVAQAQVSALRYMYESDGKRAAVPAGEIDLTDDLGQFRVFGLPAGDYVVVASSQLPPGSSVHRQALLPIVGFDPLDTKAEYAPTFFPGTINPAEAQAISLTPGQDAAASFTMLPLRLFRIAGAALTSTGSPAAGMDVRLRHMTSGPEGMAAGTVLQDGTFQIADVPPGEFWIDIGRTWKGRVAEFASVRVAVTTEDIAGLGIVTTAGATVSGSVVFETTRPEGTFQLSVRSADVLSGTGFMSSGHVDVATDGRFTFAGLDARRLLFQPISPQWTVKSVMLDGREMGDEPLDLPAGRSVSGLRVTVTDRLTQVSGAVKDDRGQPMKDHLVILLRTDGVTALPLQGVRVVATGGDGRFHVVGMRSGAYVVGVVDYLEPGSHFSPDFQERLRTRGRRFSLDEGEGVTLDLTPTPGLQ
jgi:hypothetical protein